MSDPANVPVPAESASSSSLPLPPAPPSGPPGWARFLYNHNPFYLISTAFVLMGIRLAYGNVAIGELNCWLMMLTLTGYTLLVAGTGILIVRWGQVWDDARSIMLALCLLFVAISISTDELLLIQPDSAIGLIVYGYLLAAGVSQAVITGTGMRMPRGYLWPFHAMLLLLHTYAYFCSPEARDLTRSQLDWRVFLFPQCFALLLLMLWPAVRRGAAYVADNRTPWSWPLYPGSLFVVLAGVAAFRSYVLSLSFGPSPESDYAVIFGAYFLIPMLLVTAFLVYEGARSAHRTNVMTGLLWCLPVLLLLAVPTGTSLDFQRFFNAFTSICGSPLWLTAWALLFCYAAAWLRGQSGAYAGVIGGTLLLSMLSPDTRMLTQLSAPSPAGLLALSGLLFVPGWRHASSRWLLGSLISMVAAVYVGAVQLLPSEWRLQLAAHVLLLGLLLLTVLMSDAFTRVLSHVAAGLMLYLSFNVAANGMPVDLSRLAVSFYVLGTTVVAWGCWKASRCPAYLWVVGIQFTQITLALFAWSYLYGITLIGRPAMFSLSWGTAFFGIGLLISLLKAGQLQFLKRWYARSLAATRHALETS